MVDARSFRYLCGLTILFVHFSSIALIATTDRYAEWFDQITGVLTIVPVTAIYVSLFIKYVLRDNEKSSRSAPERLNLMNAFTMYICVLMFSTALLYTIVKFSFFSSYNQPEFDLRLSASEAAFGGFISLVFERLFDIHRS